MKYINGKNIRKPEPYTYQREYNLTQIVLGVLGISVIIAPIISSIMILNYLHELNSKTLFLDSIRQNFIGILIPTAIYISSPFIILVIMMIRYEDS